MHPNTPQPLPGLTAALCALSFFRNRHRPTGRGRKPRRNLNDYCASVRLAREHIRLARAAGWRGSIVAAVTRQHAGALPLLHLA